MNETVAFLAVCLAVIGQAIVILRLNRQVRTLEMRSNERFDYLNKLATSASDNVFLLADATGYEFVEYYAKRKAERRV